MLIKFLYRKFRTLKKILKLIPQGIKVASYKSYYPEKEVKCYLHRCKDNIYWIFKYKEINQFYTAYGLDLKNSNLNEYIDYKTFMDTRNKLNNYNKPNSQIILLRDKYLFYTYMKNHNIPVPEVFAILKDGNIFDIHFNKVKIERLENRKNFFIKDIDGECASFVKKLSSIDELKSNEEISTKIQKGLFILQESLIQNNIMNQLNAGALNTIRLITINKNGQVYPLSAVMRIGTSMTGNVDNWAAGGLAVGINQDGSLKKYGYYKPAFGKKTSTHPDSNIKFEGFKIPQYKDAIEIACKAHKFLYGVHSIGWDIAITNNGPQIIEGNDNYEISINQVANGSLKNEWLEAIKI